jgi:uncharacterized membrane protein YccC
LITAAQAVGLGLRRLTKPSPIIDSVLTIIRKALPAWGPQGYLHSLDAIVLQAVAAKDLSIEDAYVLDRCRYLIEVLGDLRDGLVSVRTGRLPRRAVRIPVHQDYVAVVLNGLRACLTVAIVGFLSIMSGLPGSTEILLGTVVFVSLGSVTPDPLVMGKAALYMMPFVAITGTIYDFLIFPNIDGYPLFIISLAPVVIVMCWLIKTGRNAMGLFYGI